MDFMYRSGQSQSTSNVSHTNPGAAKDYGHQFYSDVAGDSTCIGKNVTTAWGGQQYPHEVRNSAFVYGG